MIAYNCSQLRTVQVVADFAVLNLLFELPFGNLNNGETVFGTWSTYCNDIMNLVVF